MFMIFLKLVEHFAIPKMLGHWGEALYSHQIDFSVFNEFCLCCGSVGSCNQIAKSE